MNAKIGLSPWPTNRWLAALVVLVVLAGCATKPARYNQKRIIKGKPIPCPIHDC